MDIAGLAHNRVFQVGAVVAVAAGGYAVYKRRQAGGSSGALVASGAAAASPGNPATLDSVGTDVATQLGQFEQAQQSALDQFAGQLTTSLNGLQGGHTGTPIYRSTGNRGQTFQAFANGANISQQALLAMNPSLASQKTVAPHTTLIVGYR